MQQSAFDIETYARTHRENMMREAVMARKVHLALGTKQAYRVSPWERVCRISAAARCWLVARGREAARALSPAPVISPDPASRNGQEALQLADQRRPLRASDLYAGMVVVARAAAIPVAEQPCNVNER